VEIACDESGSEGGKLVGAVTDVFAHASVSFDLDSAADCLREIRAHAPTLAREYKAGHVLRHRKAPEWLLGDSSPLHDNAHVFLVDKTFYLITKLFNDEEQAIEFYHRRPEPEFLLTANDNLRKTTVLDPLIPAIRAAVDHWGATELVHDQHNALDEDTIAHLKETTRLTRITLVDSRHDPRIQIADVLAGVARKIASNARNGQRNAELTELLAPFVNPASIWSGQL
jgi:hypothetical protein